MKLAITDAKNHLVEHNVNHLKPILVSSKAEKLYRRDWRTTITKENTSEAWFWRDRHQLSELSGKEWVYK